VNTAEDHVTLLGRPTTPSKASHREESLDYIGPRGLRPQGPCCTVPVVHLLLDDHYRNAWRGHCECGWESPPYTDIEAAQLDSWNHAYPGRVSDLREAQLRAHANGSELVEAHA
jgi:hypothetical protein